MADIVDPHEYPFQNHYEYVNTERLVRTFRHLVSIDALSYKEYDIANYLQSKLLALGLDVQEDDAAEKLFAESGLTRMEYEESAVGNLYAKLPGNGTLRNEPSILFSGHLDTVEPGKEKKAVLHEDGTITSGGNTVLGADDAAALAEILELITILVEHPELPHPPMEFVFPIAEEVYSRGSSVLNYFKLDSTYGYVLDKSGRVGTAAVAAPAIVSIDITVKGRAAHAGFAPEDGVHTIQIASNAIAALELGRKGDDTTVNIGIVEGGVAGNIVPGTTHVVSEVRSLSNQKALDETELVRRKFAAAAEVAGGSIDFSYDVKIPAYRISPSEEVVVKFQRAAKALDLPYGLEDTFGGSDNNHFVEHGIRGIVLACGMNRVHSTDEYTSVDELEKAAALILQIATHI